MNEQEYYKANLRRLIKHYSSDEYLGQSVTHLLHLYEGDELKEQILETIAQRDHKVDVLVSLYKETK
ncbi:hypothetical protein [Vibrio cholerae]|uniref:hypothetical protein n=1 Tax=Vibrio cholerae TaxID=666 RepID=UPI00084A7127|nr:hypothetical protein [Vibrio cholerae]OEC29954.1 hypothetical protein BFX13_18285 [Vibrio cholerae]